MEWLVQGVWRVPDPHALDRYGRQEAHDRDRDTQVHRDQLVGLDRQVLHRVHRDHAVSVHRDHAAFGVFHRLYPVPVLLRAMDPVLVSEEAMEVPHQEPETVGTAKKVV